MDLINNLIFLNKWWLILMILPFFSFLLKKDSSKDGIYFPNLSYLEEYNSKNIIFHKNIKNFLYYYFIWFLLVLALMQPNFINEKTQKFFKGYDLMLVTDLSGSMRSLDFTINKNNIITRLDVSKDIIKDFILNKKNARIANIIFADYAYLDTPLTTDYKALAHNIDKLEIGMVGEQTAIGDALALAVKKLYLLKKKTRAIILLTDGENTAGKILPIQASNLAQKYNIPIYTIAIGKSGEIPFLDKYGRIGYSNNVFDTSILREISKNTQGMFFQATNKDELKDIYDVIDNLTKVKSKANIFFQYKSLYHYFIILALFLLFLPRIINFVKRQGSN